MKSWIPVGALLPLCSCGPDLGPLGDDFYVRLTHRTALGTDSGWMAAVASDTHFGDCDMTLRLFTSKGSEPLAECVRQGGSFTRVEELPHAGMDMDIQVGGYLAITDVECEQTYEHARSYRPLSGTGTLEVWCSCYYEPQYSYGVEDYGFDFRFTLEGVRWWDGEHKHKVAPGTLEMGKGDVRFLRE